MKQNTPEWLEMRKNKIGASDAPIIMKQSPWKTPYELWREKMSLVESEPDTYPQSEGRRKEPIARAALERKLGIALEPSIRLHNQRSWMMASLDAISADSSIIAEIKCPGKADHEIAMSGQVPQHYIPQLQHQMEVCNVELAHYFSFDGLDGVLLKVYRDDKYIKSLISEEEKFFECMNNFEAPELMNRDYTIRTDAKWMKKVERLQELKKLIVEEEEIKKELISMTEGRNTMGGGIKLSKCVRKGVVEYSKIPELKNVNLESYRKKSSEYWRIT